MSKDADLCTFMFCYLKKFQFTFSTRHCTSEVKILTPSKKLTIIVALSMSYSVVMLQLSVELLRLVSFLQFCVLCFRVVLCTLRLQISRCPM